MRRLHATGNTRNVFSIWRHSGLVTMVLESTTSFVVDLGQCVDLRNSLERLRRSGDDLIDRWDGSTLVRTAPSRGRNIAFAAEPRQNAHGHSEFVVTIAEPAHRDDVETVVRSTFLLPTPAFCELTRTDPRVHAAHVRYPSILPILEHDLLAAMVRSISAQQVNLRWAATTRSRLAQRFGDRHEVGKCYVYSFDAERLARATTQQIRDLQFTTRKSESIIGVAQEIAEGKLSLPELRRFDDDTVIRRLTSLKGIGLWSAEWILCSSLGRPRVVAGDLGVRRVVGRAYLKGRLGSEAEVRDLTRHWGEAATIAQNLLLFAYAGWA